MVVASMLPCGTRRSALRDNTTSTSLFQKVAVMIPKMHRYQAHLRLATQTGKARKANLRRLSHTASRRCDAYSALDHGLPCLITFCRRIRRQCEAFRVANRWRDACVYYKLPDYHRIHGDNIEFIQLVGGSRGLYKASPRHRSRTIHPSLNMNSTTSMEASALQTFEAAVNFQFVENCYFVAALCLYSFDFVLTLGQ
ncbi:hypothetical protein DAEQUDRAFT_537393 [Daedalea quercina L-15889]|uniref:Uncharacterized protein n=1 Tax=Daedalea quercina L-15889 TaxID=1314783 RepID=A0A165M5P4_9APHY|nr:hypothetical protein DAEQUDRAFT_537393 [Daedalea quercina L-15889]